MPPSYLSNSGIPEYLFGAICLIWAGAEFRQGLHQRTGASRADASSIAVVRIALVAGALVAAGIATTGVMRLPPTVVTYAIGMVALVAGLGLRVWCFRTLGHYFTFTVQTSADQQVITTGPYRLLRHPSYLAILLCLAGLAAVAFANLLSVAALVLIPLMALLNRIRVEEGALARELGPRYTDYAATRKRLLPYIW